MNMSVGSRALWKCNTVQPQDAGVIWPTAFGFQKRFPAAQHVGGNVKVETQNCATGTVAGYAKRCGIEAIPCDPLFDSVAQHAIFHPNCGLALWRIKVVAVFQSLFVKMSVKLHDV